jgi:hypothetical protein
MATEQVTTEQMLKAVVDMLGWKFCQPLMTIGVLKAYLPDRPTLFFQLPAELLAFIAHAEAELAKKGWVLSIQGNLCAIIDGKEVRCPYPTGIWKDPQLKAEAALAAMYWFAVSAAHSAEDDPIFTRAEEI